MLAKRMCGSDQAVTDQDVVVERYGEPRIVIVDYRRYIRLITSEQELIRLRLRESSAAASARSAKLTDEKVDDLIERARDEASPPKRRRRISK